MAKATFSIWRDADGKMQTRRETIAPMPDELQQIIKELG